jgi:hypothetical protein
MNQFNTCENPPAESTLPASPVEARVDKLITRTAWMFVITAIALLLSSCGMMQPTSDMSAAQITAATKDKNASVICSTIRGVWGSAELITITLDQNAIRDGGIAADNKGGCNATIQSAAPPKTPIPVKEPVNDAHK